jgi:8-oxo-dGTP pyrophosphatase MutT (NUDIX family)
MQGGPLRPVLADRFNAAILGAAPIVRVYRDGAGEPEALWIQYVDHPFWRLPAGPPPPSAGGM